MAKVACIGECMIELRETAEGQITRGWGGDTLNTAVYLARLGFAVDYVTALGDDPWSDEMMAGWRAEGVGTDLVQRQPGRLPGLYIIQTDAKGERRFFYWRDSAPARDLFALEQTAAICEALAVYDLVYFSGVSLSLYGETGRDRLFEALDRARSRGARIAFDTNFRQRGWPDRKLAHKAYRLAFSRADFILASTEDLEPLFGPEGVDEVKRSAGSAEVVLKLAEPACRVITRDRDLTVRAEPVAKVVDTTAAGDSFAAAYLSVRLTGADPVVAARAGHRLAGVVVQHPGAIIPRGAMPADILPSPAAHMEDRP